MPDFILDTEDQAAAYLDTDQAAGQLFLVHFAPSNDFEGELTLEKFDKLAYAADPSGYTPDTEVVGAPPPAKLAVSLPNNWKARFVLTTATAGSVGVSQVYHNPGLYSYPTMFSPENLRSDMATGIAGVVTDLEGDTGGDSVAQAITDLEALI